jgi:zinc D-Ala-D-Ala carboxypeptidase
MQLSKNFSLKELTVTQVSAENEPFGVQLENLQNLVDNVLQPLRDLYGKPIRVTSGFRSSVVNKKVGGAANSQHCKGEAADLVADSYAENNADLFKIIRESLTFDQLIWEAGNDEFPAWVHVSFRKGNNRKQVLRMINGKYQVI